MACLPRFAEGVVLQDPEWSREDWLARQILWNFLVDDAEMVDTIMKVSPRWDPAGQRLLVSTWADAGPDGRKAVLRVLRHFCSWVNFTITCWASARKAARCA